jgi:hypothetical protein
MHLVDVSQRLLDTAVTRLRTSGLASHIIGVHRASATDLSVLPDACCNAVLLLGPLYKTDIELLATMPLPEVEGLLSARLEYHARVPASY